MQLSARGCNVASPKVCNSQYVSALSKDSRGMFFLLRPTDSLILQISREPRGQYTLSTGSRKVTDLFGSRSRLLCERRLSLMKYIYVASALPVKCMFMATNPGSLRISAHNPVSSAPQVHLFLLFSSPSNPTVHSCHVMICAIIFANVKDQSGAHSGTMRVMCHVATSRRPAECLGGALVPRLPQSEVCV